MISKLNLSEKGIIIDFLNTIKRGYKNKNSTLTIAEEMDTTEYLFIL